MCLNPDASLTLAPPACCNISPGGDWGIEDASTDDFNATSFLSEILEHCASAPTMTV